jgi:serine/threonine-protein kinase
MGTIKGKLGYMAPEQAQGVSVDRRTDVFSAGVVLWEFLANRCLRLEDPLTMLQKIATEETPALSTVAPDVPRALEAIVTKATARSPEDRYATALEMRLALEEYLAGQESTVTTADAAQAITKHFAWERQVLSERIREVISGTPPGGASQQVFTELPAVPDLKTNAGTPGIRTDQLLSEMSKSSRRPKIIAVAVMVGVALLVVAALRLVPRDGVVSGDTPASNAAATGAVTIESTPTSASVRLDGTFIGTTPLTARATAGRHQVTVLKEGFTEASSSIETKSGETVKLSLALLPASAAEKPQETTAPEKDASNGRVPGKETVAPKTVGGGQAKPNQRALHSQPKASPVLKTRPAPTQPNIPIIDESSDAKVNVDVIE